MDTTAQVIQFHTKQQTMQSSKFSKDPLYQCGQWWKNIMKDMELQQCADAYKRQNMLDASSFDARWRPNIGTYLLQYNHHKHNHTEVELSNN